MSRSGGLKPNAVAGGPSVTRLTHSSCHDNKASKLSSHLGQTVPYFVLQRAATKAVHDTKCFPFEGLLALQPPQCKERKSDYCHVQDSAIDHHLARDRNPLIWKCHTRTVCGQIALRLGRQSQTWTGMRPSGRPNAAVRKMEATSPTLLLIMYRINAFILL